MKTLKQQDKHPSIGKDILFQGVPNQAIRNVYNGKEIREMHLAQNKNDNKVVAATVIIAAVSFIWWWMTV